MKSKTKINIISWVLVLWGLLGLLRGVYLPLILVPLGVGILLRKNIARVALVYLSFLSICMAILGFFGFLLATVVPAVTNKQSGHEVDMKLLVVWVGMLAMFIIMGLIFFYIYRLFKKPEIIAEFPQKMKSEIKQ